MTGSRITLSNPTAGQWDDFIADNARTSGATAYMDWIMPRLKRLRPGQRVNLTGAPKPPTMAVPNAASGRKLVLCGAGPSLKTHWAHYLGPEGICLTPKTDVWACNSALTWLLAQGAHVTHGFAIDQTEGLLSEWASTPNVRYIIASSVNPKLVALLQSKGRHLTWFHNFVGSQDEARLYRTIWPSSVMVGDGLNSVNRAMCLAQYMGYKSVTVLGADGALAAGDVMHANGDGPLAHGATAVIMEGVINGRTWSTKPDMIFSAVQMAKMAGKAFSRYRVIGDTLASALLEEAERRNLSSREFATWMDEEIASLETMKGIPHPAGTGSGAREQPKGRIMSSKVFNIRQGGVADDRTVGIAPAA
jgi:hypothetical protein